jgi:hypothetical protein
MGGPKAVGEDNGECVERWVPTHGPSSSADAGLVKGTGHQTWDFRAACSVGKCHRARTARRYREFTDLLTLVEQITRADLG